MKRLKTLPEFKLRFTRFQSVISRLLRIQPSIRVILVTATLSILSYASLKAQVFVFSRNIAGTEIIFTSDGVFSSITQLTTEDTSCYDPRVSPDGIFIAYVKGVPGVAGDIWVMSKDGSGKKRITYDTTFINRNPSWHPNGKQIIYEAASRTDPAETYIRIVNKNGTNDHILLNNAGDKDRFPCLNPADTNKLVYHFDPGNWEYFSQVRMHNLFSGTDEILMDNNGWADGYFSISLNGNLLLWSEKENGDEMRLRVLNLTTRSITNINTVKGPYCHITGIFDQTGKNIFFTRRSSSEVTEVVRCSMNGSFPIVIYTSGNINNLSLIPGGPVASYVFEGNTRDISGYRNDAVSGSPTLTYDRFINSDQAYFFNGTDNYMTVPQNETFNFGTGDFTIFAFISTNTIPPPGTWNPIISNHSLTAQGDNGFIMGIEGGAGFPFFELSTSTGETERVTGPETLPPFGFHAICAVRERGELKLYVGQSSSFYLNEILKDSTLSTINLNNNNSLNFGRSPQNNGAVYFYGIIDDIRIYSRALSGIEMILLMREGLPTTYVEAPCSGCDLMTEWITPEENPLCGTQEQQPVKVRIKNIGTGDALNFTVSYSLDGGTNFISEECKAKLAPNDSIDFTFTQTADMFNLGTWSCVAKVKEFGDSDNNNDYDYIQVVNNRIDFQVETEESLCAQSTGTALTTGLVNGIPPYTYTWSDGQSTDHAVQLPSGFYHVTITDSHECSVTKSFMIDEAGAPEIGSNISITHNSCYGMSEGSIDIGILGGTAPYTFLWSNGSMSEDINGLAVGKYQVSVTDQTGCKALGSFQITEPAPLYISAAGTNSDADASNGTAEIFVSGGTPPYGYLWSTGNTGSQETSLSGGHYTAVITDANGCKDSSEITIFDLCGPDIAVNSITPSACGANNGMIDINISGEIDQFVYEWSTGDTIQDLINIPSGEYTVTVAYKDSTCASVATITVPAQLEPVPICMVSVDTNNHNMIIWQKPASTGEISAFNIYRETDWYDRYELIGTRTIGEESYFIDEDPKVNTAVQAWRYKLSVVDTCGNESELSGVHKTLHLLMNEGLENTVNLIWDNYMGFDYYTCHIYRYSPQDGLQNIFNKAASPWLVYNSFTDLTPPSSDNYFYFVELESPYTCESRKKASSHNSVRSNKTKKQSSSGIIAPDLPKDLRNIGLYPNPNSGVFNLTMDTEKSGNLIIRIFDSYGRMIYNVSEFSPGHIDHEISLPGNSRGVYLLQVVMNDGVVVRPFVID